MRIAGTFRLLAALIVGCLGLAETTMAQPVGTMTAFQTLITRIGDGNLNVGADIFLGDHLISNETGLGMIVFDDESSAKIGPNAELIIDDFVYDPATGTGSSTIQVNSGLLRLYGGQISKQGDMTVATPHVVLGVRGGIVETDVVEEEEEGDRTVAVLRAGILFCILGDIVKIITNPGFGCVSDGTTIDVRQFPEDFAEILDDVAAIAGTFEPGDFGDGFDVDEACASVLAPYLPFCQSTDGGLPGAQGGGGNNLPDEPMGAFDDCEYECCDCED